jgi:hypothetical protein
MDKIESSLVADNIKKLSNNFLSASYYFLEAHFYCSPLNEQKGDRDYRDYAERALRRYDEMEATDKWIPPHYKIWPSPIDEQKCEPSNFSEWLDSEDEEITPIDKMKERLLHHHNDILSTIYTTNSNSPAHKEDPLKNMAYEDLYLEIHCGRIFNFDAIDDFDYQAFVSFSQVYLSLSVLYEFYGETIEFIKEHNPDCNPYYFLESLREELSMCGHRAIGYWYANSQEVRGFVDREKKMQQARSSGGFAKAEQFKEKHELWKSMACEMRNKNPKLSKSSIAQLIAKKTGHKYETIRKKI